MTKYYSCFVQFGSFKKLVIVLNMIQGRRSVYMFSQRIFVGIVREHFQFFFVC